MQQMPHYSRENMIGPAKVNFGSRVSTVRGIRRA